VLKRFKLNNKTYFIFTYRKFLRVAVFFAGSFTPLQPKKVNESTVDC